MKKAILTVAAAVALSSCGREEIRRTEAVPGPAVPSRVVAAALQERPAGYTATGTVRAGATVAVSSKVMAYVQQVHVRQGDLVREGQLLFTLDSRDLDSNVRRADAGRKTAESAIPEVEHAIAAARSNLDLAQVTFERIQGLAAKQSASKQELDEASARLKSARSAYEMAVARRAETDARIVQAGEEQAASKVMRGYAEIQAPFAGVVTDKPADPGILAAPGVSLLTLEREGSYRLEAAVEESRIPAVRVGQSVPVLLEQWSGNGRVTEIVPAVDPATRSYTVKIALDPVRGVPLRTGMFGKAVFPLATRKVVAVPAAAVTERGQLQSVLVVENGTAQVRLITAGERWGEWVEVLSGLSEGEKVGVRP